MSTKSDYKLLTVVRDDGDGHDDNDRYMEMGMPDAQERRRQSFLGALSVPRCLLVLLVLSLMANALQYLFLSRPRTSDYRSFTGLAMDVPTPITIDGRTLEDEVWQDSRLDTYTGMVALDKAFIAQEGLLPSQPFPWNHEKSIYLFHGFHSLHCVMMLRDVLRDAAAGKQWSWSMHHATHCLTVLREDILCYADDFPRYTGPFNAEQGKSQTSSGTGSIRMCRNWDKLREFAQQHSACYKRIDNITTTLDRYKFCPDGSKPWEESMNKE